MKLRLYCTYKFFVVFFFGMFVLAVFTSDASDSSLSINNATTASTNPQLQLEVIQLHTPNAVSVVTAVQAPVSSGVIQCWCLITLNSLTSFYILCELIKCLVWKQLKDKLLILP